MIILIPDKDFLKKINWKRFSVILAVVSFSAFFLNRESPSPISFSKDPAKAIFASLMVIYVSGLIDRVIPYFFSQK